MARKNSPIRPPTSDSSRRRPASGPRGASVGSRPRRLAEPPLTTLADLQADLPDADDPTPLLTPGADAATGEPADAPAGERLQKFLAEQGVGSRRDMEARIAAGQVSVNGETAILGLRVRPGDVVRIGGRGYKVPAVGRLPRVLIYHKPEGEISTHEDAKGRPTVFERLPRIRGGKWVAIGRLDVNSCGLMILTSSGDLANRLMHPRFEVEREYAVRTLGELDSLRAGQLLAGVELDDGPAKFDRLLDAGGEGSNHWYRVVIREGRKREVRRLFEAVGLMVSRLMRVRFGPVELPNHLKRGALHELSDEEVAKLLHWADLPIEGIVKATVKRPGATRKPRAVLTHLPKAPVTKPAGASQSATTARTARGATTERPRAPRKVRSR